MAVDVLSDDDIPLSEWLVGDEEVSDSSTEDLDDSSDSYEPQPVSFCSL